MAEEEKKVRRGCVVIPSDYDSLAKFDISKKGDLPDVYSPEYYKKIKNPEMIAKENYKV